MESRVARRLLLTVLRRLVREYGPRRWRPRGSAVGVLVCTILSQNTSNANSSAGLRQLWRRFRNWYAVANAPVAEIERCIRVSGLSRRKAPRIQSILQHIRHDRGRLSLEFLKDLPADEARRYLLGFEGVGPKTANCVLLFAFGGRVFPVDTHIHRMAIRLGVLDEAVSPEAAHDILEPLIAPADRYAMHVLLIAHGRRVCTARSPKCHWCCLLDVCPAGRDRIAEPSGAESVG